MAFQSKFRDNEKLRNCAENDRDHLGQGVTAPENLVGDHIALIHEALIAWALKQSPPKSIISPQEFREKRYGDSTSTLVSLFKARHKPPILNFRGEIDNIVGKKTVVALDLELPPKQGGDPSPATQQTRVDIILKFAGVLKADVTPLNVNDVPPSVRIKDYLARTDRVLVRLGQEHHSGRSRRHHSKSTLRRGILFTSSMGGQEVHGNIVDFAPRDLTKDVQDKTPASDDDAHIILSQVAKDEVFGDLVAKLKED